MTCDEAREQFSLLYDGLLSGAGLASLSRHLDDCPACAEEWRAFHRATRAVAELGMEEPAPGFADRVMARLTPPARWRVWVRALLFPLPVKLPLHATALLLVGAAGWWMARPGMEAPPPVRVERPAPLPVPTTTALPPPPVPGKIPPPRPAPAPGDRPADSALPPAPPASPEREAAPAPPPPEARLQAAPAPAEQFKAALPEGERQAARRSQAVPPRQEAPPAAGMPASGAPAEARRDAGTPGPLPADALFSQAATAFAAREYAGAAQGLRTFLRDHPGDRRGADARFFLAEAHYETRRYAEAASAYGEYLEQHPGHRHVVPALYRLGLSRLALGDATGCGHLRRALERAPRAEDAPAARAALAAHCP